FKASRRLLDIGNAKCIIFKLVEISVAVDDIQSNSRCIRFVSAAHYIFKHFIVNQLLSNFQADSESVHACNMCMEQIVLFKRSSSYFGIKVQAAAPKSAIFKDFIHGQSG